MAAWRAAHSRSAAAVGAIVIAVILVTATCAFLASSVGDDASSRHAASGQVSRATRGSNAELNIMHIADKTSRYSVFPFVSVVVMVTSAAGWSDRRLRIRDQFPRNLRLISTPEEESVILKFAIGTQGLDESVLKHVKGEARNHSDMLFFDCPDEDTDLKHPHLWRRNGDVSSTTSKVMLSIQWAVRHFDFQYYFRLGDDSYFRIDKFMTLLTLKELPSSKAVVGHIMTDTVFDMQQLYPQGMGYGLTYDVCVFIARNVEFLMRTAPEDCVVARWLFAVGAEFVDSPLWRDIHMGDHCHADMILAHKLPAELWREIANDGTIEC